ncbi:MAG: hypothetical protein EOO72_10690, partial [Myxococcaceae bacterium]
MQSRKWRVISRAGATAMTLGLMSGSVAMGAETQPGSEQGSSTPPSRIVAGRKLHQPPGLGGTGMEARKSVQAFITWAGQSVVLEQEDARQVLRAAADNPDIIQAFAEEILE